MIVAIVLTGCIGQPAVPWQKMFIGPQMLDCLYKEVYLWYLVGQHGLHRNYSMCTGGGVKEVKIEFLCKPSDMCSPT